MDPGPGSTSFSAESYFATQPAPPSLAQDIAGVQEFIARQVAQNRKVVLVTSGGTTVPLELNVVRFLDNFSAGTRGATSAEYFLKAGYAVIFMHRQFSLQPFSRHYSHSTNPFLDFLVVEPGGDTVGVEAEKRGDLLGVLAAYKGVQAAGVLHTLTFVTVNDYLWLLRAISQEMSLLRRKAMYYLAAAVSDFFLPRQKMSEHKIQSGKGSLHIEMDQVPKVLKPLVEEWTPDGYIVSFKLETDEHLLIPKARAALERYGHQVVIGNDLHTRKYQVVFVSRKKKPLPPLPPGADQQEEAEPETNVVDKGVTTGEAQVQAPTPSDAPDAAQSETTPAAETIPTPTNVASTDGPSVDATAPTSVDAEPALSPNATSPEMDESAPPPPPPPKPHPPAPIPDARDEEESLTFVESWLRIAPAAATAGMGAKEIEEDIVGELVRRHGVWIAGEQL